MFLAASLSSIAIHLGISTSTSASSIRLALCNAKIVWEQKGSGRVSLYYCVMPIFVLVQEPKPKYGTDRLPGIGLNSEAHDVEAEP
jgi:hypothetical protein